MNKLSSKFAFLPIRRWVPDYGHFVKTEGWYWLRKVLVMKAGLLNEWTAYARHND